MTNIPVPASVSKDLPLQRYLLGISNGDIGNVGTIVSGLNNGGVALTAYATAPDQYNLSQNWAEVARFQRTANGAFVLIDFWGLYADVTDQLGTPPSSDDSQLFNWRLLRDGVAIETFEDTLMTIAGHDPKRRFVHKFVDADLLNDGSTLTYTIEVRETIPLGTGVTLRDQQLYVEERSIGPSQFNFGGLPTTDDPVTSDPVVLQRA